VDVDEEVAFDEDCASVRALYFAKEYDARRSRVDDIGFFVAVPDVQVDDVVTADCEDGLTDVNDDDGGCLGGVEGGVDAADDADDEDVDDTIGSDVTVDEPSILRSTFPSSNTLPAPIISC
jgi:hypothetical protein